MSPSTELGYSDRPPLYEAQTGNYQDYQNFGEEKEMGNQEYQHQSELLKKSKDQVKEADNLLKQIRDQGRGNNFRKEKEELATYDTLEIGEMGDLNQQRVSKYIKNENPSDLDTEDDSSGDSYLDEFFEKAERLFYNKKEGPRVRFGSQISSKMSIPRSRNKQQSSFQHNNSSRRHGDSNFGQSSQGVGYSPEDECEYDDEELMNNEMISWNKRRLIQKIFQLQFLSERNTDMAEKFQGTFKEMKDIIEKQRSENQEFKLKVKQQNGNIRKMESQLSQNNQKIQEEATKCKAKEVILLQSQAKYEELAIKVEHIKKSSK